MILGLAITALAIWVCLLFFRGFFWREFSIAPRGRLAGREACPTVAVVIPARDEAGAVAFAVGSLAKQSYPGRLHIFLADDGSTDGTAAVAREAVAPDLLTVVNVPPLPAGWTGKLWALSEGVRSSAVFEPEFLLFTDADIVHPADGLESLVGRAESAKLDMVSLMAKLACRTPAERALVPAFVFFFFLLYPPAWIANPRRGTAGAAGGCILIRRSILEEIGGLEAIRGAWIDDCALAAAVKARGGRVWLGLGRDTESMRSYKSFAETGLMISRSAFTQLHHSVWLLLAALLGLAVTYFMPPLLTLFAKQPAAGIAATAWLLMTITYIPALRFYGRSWIAAPLLPLVALFYAGATVHSALVHWLRGGAQWKGRQQK